MDDISREGLHDPREQTEGEIPRERVLAAIDRKQDDKIETLAERHGVVEKTIRNWLDQFEDEPIEQAPYDAPRPGGPSKITTEEREQLEGVLQNLPTNLGYNHQAWSLKLLLHYVKEEFDVEYIESHARYLLHEAGLSARTARPRNHEADSEEEAGFKQTVEKTTRTDRQDRRRGRSIH